MSDVPQFSHLQNGHQGIALRIGWDDLSKEPGLELSTRSVPNSLAAGRRPPE